MDSEDIDTIQTILEDYDIDAFLNNADFNALLDALKTRENIMIMDAKK